MSFFADQMMENVENHRVFVGGSRISVAPRTLLQFCGLLA